ncbi:unnamed protein product, partial [Enterobius vermicularis]|uniref:Nuclear receptor domain-containing protein n=1 Tax=Enterobius vermicularis TaxID=51028 RepID=A0A0N4VNT9_ENTVE
KKKKNGKNDGQHFGAVACRACAAFFRRSTVTDRKYTCRYNNNYVRCMCRACRFRKCVELGMNAKSWFISLLAVSTFLLVKYPQKYFHVF